MSSTAASERVSYSVQEDGTINLVLSGTWRLEDAPPSVAEILPLLRERKRLSLEGSQILSWDSSLPTYLLEILRHCRTEKLAVDCTGLPEGVRRILDLAGAAPRPKGSRRKLLGVPVLARIGNLTIELSQTWWDSVEFIGETTLSLARMLRGKTRFRRVDLVTLLEQCGAQALPIVTLISVLIGMILAFIGAVQLRMFGAQIFVANLVTLGMAREMGATMTGVIMAGRTGAAFAAQLGSMQVNDEIDALRTMGIPPVDFLVLPRILALVFMMPFLTVYAICLGVLGGAIVSAAMLDVSFFEFYNQAREFVDLRHFVIGVAKSGVYGVIIAMAGCLRGMQCGRSASAVGYAATSAVVTSIVWMVVADAVITIACQVLDL